MTIVWSLIHSNTSIKIVSGPVRWKKKSNPRKLAKIQVQVKHFVAYTDAASQHTNFDWKASW